MAFAVVQIGATLKLLDDTGALNALTLPTGVTLRTDVPPRFLLADRYAILVNTPSEPLLIDGTGTVRVLTPHAPRVAPVVTAVSGGSLTGTYTGIRYTFITRDVDGNIISESDYSPASGSVSPSGQAIQAAGLDISPDDISARRLYRPISGGAVLFQWVDLDGNVLTSIQDDLADAGLSLIAAPVLGSAPHLTHIASFRGRIFGVGSEDIDHVRYSEAGIRYAWPEDNLLEIPNVGSDALGVTAFLQRREALGVGRANRLVQITGSGAENTDTGSIDLDVVLVSNEVGITSQESVDVWNDTGIFLWQDGVYGWGADGITCLSDGRGDGRGQVRAWFATDDYFDRSRFSEAFGAIDQVTKKYRLYLIDADDALWWVELDLRDRTWWGPHKTDLFVPKSTFTFITDDQVRIPLVGGTDGNCYEQQEIRTDGTATPIDFRAVGKRHDMALPDLDKYFGRLSVFGKAQDSGKVTVLSRVGNLNGTLTQTQYHLLTKNRSNLGRLGTGKHAQIEFRHATAGQEVELFGYEVDDVHSLGRR